MLGVEVVAVGSAVGLPKVVIVNFGSVGQFPGENLSIDGAIFFLDHGDEVVGLELGGRVAAVVGSYLEVGGELLDEALFEGVREAILVGVLRVGDGGEKE